MIEVALRGLLGRKLRAVLTAFAIVLGVATVSGTYVLTDSISDAFDNIFTGVYRGTDAVVTGKAAFDLGDQGGVQPPAFDESLLQKVRDAARGRRGDRRGRRRGAADRLEREGDPVRRRAQSRLFGRSDRYPQFNSAGARRGQMARSGPVRARHLDRGQEGHQDRRTRSACRRRARRSRCRCPGSSSSAPSPRSAAPRSPASTSIPRSGSSTRKGGSTRSGPRARKGVVSEHSCWSRSARSSHRGHRCEAARTRRRRTRATRRPSRASSNPSCSPSGASPSSSARS